jgi:DNA-nicking Smr family endonuclease
MAKKRPRTETGAADLWDAPAAGTLDLHHHTRDQARRSLENFITTCYRAHSGRVVHIITGKGHRSANGPVLPGLVRGMLENGLRRYVGEVQKDLDEAGFRVRMR